MVCATEGDAGDMIFTACVLKHIGGGPHTFVVQTTSEWTAIRDRQAAQNLVNFVKDLLESQPYIKEVRVMEPTDHPEWRSGGFRPARMHDPTHLLIQAYQRHLYSALNIRPAVDVKNPWLTVEPSKELEGMVVVNRTFRYNNKFFDWKRVVEHYNSRIVFIGLPGEWQAFCENFGYVSYRETKTLLEIAQLIAGCALFIGNQSCPNAVCEGMKHHSIQETSLTHPDCLFPRANAQFVADGCCILPDVSGSGVTQVPRARFKPNYLVQTSLQPRRGWKYQDLRAASHRALKNEVSVKRGITQEEAHVLIIDELMQHEPTYFGGANHEEQELATAMFAIAESNRAYVPPKIPQK